MESMFSPGDTVYVSSVSVTTLEASALQLAQTLLVIRNYLGP